jgi:tetratricopeptide (TPR) repeat protein
MKQRIKLFILIIVVLMFFLFLAPELVNAFHHNSYTLVALKTGFSSNVDLLQSVGNLLNQEGQSYCRLSWFGAKFLSNDQHQGLYPNTFNCSLEYLHILTKYRPIDLQLAQQAVQMYPKSIDALEWLAFSQEYTKPNSGLASYQEVVALDRHNGAAWCQIGQIDQNLALIDQAMSAFLECCKNQDPDGKGCYGAGQMAEKGGNMEQAIQYYRLSKADDAQNRANELEKQLHP